jgi:putative FmdB family regulatory protein
MGVPIFEYACPACEAAFETLVLRTSDEADVSCPTCGSRRVKRQMSRPAAARSGRGGRSSGGPPPGCGPVG